MKKYIQENPFLFSVFLIGLIIRCFLVIFTNGTSDVGIWDKHIVNINNLGLIEYYKSSLNTTTQFNHPPFITFFVLIIHKLAYLSGIHFKILFRIPLALTDFIIAIYILKIFDKQKIKKIIFALYFLSPVTFILSAYHGNTDVLLGLFGIISLYYLKNDRFFYSGILLGIGANVKWSILIIVPICFFTSKDLKNKILFILGIVLSMSIGYGYFLITNFNVIFNSIFKYKGQMLRTTKRVPIWGNRIFYNSFVRSYIRTFSFPNKKHFYDFIVFILKNNSLFIMLVVLIFSWFKRTKDSLFETGKSIAQVFCLFFGMTNYFSFQYFAWALPFFTFLFFPVSWIVFSFTSGYIYFLYSFLCESNYLIGKWNFIGHPYFSEEAIFFRNGSILIFMSIGIFCFFSSVYFFLKQINNSKMNSNIKSIKK